ncbi:MAG: DUF2461 domain-containing protein [Planctomycetaceae bacterium]|nr:DUF2461 domain-containing protein [Planctomycetaceae bacterium]
MSFTGFSPETVAFLAELAGHNNRDWFAANKPRYEQHVRRPALAFIEAVAAPLEKACPCIFADPTPVGGSLMRIYRDTRFGGDKTPYKTNIGIHFRHERGDDIHAPGFYFHLDPKEFFLACGIWRPEAKPLAAIRTRIAEYGDEWMSIRKDKKFAKDWGSITGERLKRPPRGFDAEHPCIEDIKLKEFLGVCDLPRETMFSRKLVDAVVKVSATAQPLMKFLCDAMAIPY